MARTTNRNVLAIALLLSIIALTESKNEFFDAVQPELRCSGCELTVKVLDRMMRKRTKNLAEHVNDVIEHVCDEKRFEVSEYKASTMLKVCHFIKDYHEDELHFELMEHYVHPERPTYFEFAQHLCIDRLKLCAAVSHKRDNNDTVLHFDHKKHDFKLKEGQTIKTARAVRDTSHDEL